MKTVITAFSEVKDLLKPINSIDLIVCFYDDEDNETGVYNANSTEELEKMLKEQNMPDYFEALLGSISYCFENLQETMVKAVHKDLVDCWTKIEKLEKRLAELEK